MSKYRCRENTKCEKGSQDCVCSVVKRIVDKQDLVGDNGNDCSTGCDRSIHQLLAGNTGPVNTTIPFILYCDGTCEAFVGSGVFQAASGAHSGSFFGCVESPIFRAKQFVKGSDCCVRLELLLPVAGDCAVPVCPVDNAGNVCPFFPTEDPITDFQATGICITVDLKHFVGITCLDPITPLPASEFYPVARKY